MTNKNLLAGAALVAFVGATAAHAQIDAPRTIDTRPTPGAVQGAIGSGVGDEIEDIEIRTQREIAAAESDEFRLGTVPQGFRGSVSLTGFSSFGNEEDVFVGTAGRFTVGAGNVSHSVSLGGEYAEDDDDDDSGFRVLGVYDLNYDISERFYGFGLLRGVYDDNAGSNRVDVFAGVGPGYRIINTETAAWRVQVGPGIRYTRPIGGGDDETELAGIFASRASFRLSSDVFLTNDTDVLYSDADTLVSNELALNSRLAGPLSARVGLRTDWTSDPADDQEDTDNRVTLGVVYSFQ
jgi:putative salt-induced outer membrane protein